MSTCAMFTAWSASTRVSWKRLPGSSLRVRTSSVSSWPWSLIPLAPEGASAPRAAPFRGLCDQQDRQAGAGCQCAPPPRAAVEMVEWAAMRILHALTYYHPHLSGLTIYVERLAETLAARGHEVTVATSRHLPSLARAEQRNGVRVVRAPVLLRVHKRVISPAFTGEVYRLMRSHDVVNLHLPLMEAGALTRLARRFARRPVVLTYHCDLRLPPSLTSGPIELTLTLMHRLAGRLANRIVTYTHDYAEHSPFVSRY